MLNAIYTMTLKDALATMPSLLDGITWDSEEHTTKLRDMIMAKFFNWEISGETLQEEALFLEMKFNEYKDYYLELLEAYETEIDNWLAGTVVSEEGEASSESSKDFTPRAEYTNEDYDLPRSTTSENRPSAKHTSKGTGGKDTTEDESSGSHSLTRTTGDPIEQKAKYMKLLRSVYSEFADKFKPCFIDLFS